MTCVEGIGCTYQDADGDGAYSNVCRGPEWQGTDCNDSNPAVRPDAAEVCNGVDDDCDNYVDVDDGVPLSNREYTVDVGPEIQALSIAWLSSAGVYGLVYSDRDRGGVGSDVSYIGVAPDGSMTPATPLNITNNQSLSTSPRIAASDSSFAVVWTDDASTGSTFDVQAVRIQNGAPVGSPVLVSNPGSSSSSPTIVSDENGGWAVFWVEASGASYQVMRRRFAADLTPVTAPEMITDVSFAAVLSASRSRTTLAVSWHDSRDWSTAWGAMPKNVWAAMPTNFAQGPSGVAADAVIEILGSYDAAPGSSGRQLVTGNDAYELCTGSGAASEPSNCFALARDEALSAGGFRFVCDKRPMPSGPGFHGPFELLRSVTRLSLVDFAVAPPAPPPSASWFGGYLALISTTNASGNARLELVHVNHYCLWAYGPFALTTDSQILSADAATLAVGQRSVAVAYVEIADADQQLKVRLFGPNLCD